ncbi:MAG: diguanylate cyclase, partial [Pseudomonadota bacterium]|nr:diguanylate cyclase [Pseudomonadota bacterium]
AEILRQRVRAELSAAIGHEQEVSASFGLAQLAPGEALSDLARRSDLALYEAKNTGRDKVSLAPVDKPSLAHGQPVLISSRTAA